MVCHPAKAFNFYFGYPDICTAIIIIIIMWHGISIGNFVVKNVDWKELITGTNRSRREWWKVKISRYCGISRSSVIGESRQAERGCHN